ncbi:12198_t:CDS:2, partial [Ambispora leptoticha]
MCDQCFNDNTYTKIATTFFFLNTICLFLWIVLIAYLAGISSENWSYVDFLKLNRDILPPFSNDYNGIDSAWVTRFLGTVEELSPTLYNAEYQYPTFASRLLVIE